MDAKPRRCLHFWTLGSFLALLAFSILIGGWSMNGIRYPAMRPDHDDERSQELIGEMEGLVGPGPPRILELADGLLLNSPEATPASGLPDDDAEYDGIGPGPGGLLGKVPVKDPPMPPKESL